MAHENIEGWGADRDPKSRPGVPMELEPPRPIGEAHWTQPPQQISDVKVFKQPLAPKMPPVFGTAIPPKGLSGLIRAAAYQYPDHLTRHWLLLLMADRVNFVERMVTRFPLFVPVALAGGLVARRLAKAR